MFIQKENKRRHIYSSVSDHRENGVPEPLTEEKVRIFISILIRFTYALFNRFNRNIKPMQAAFFFFFFFFLSTPSVKLYIKDESTECDITLWTLPCQFFGCFLFVFVFCGRNQKMPQLDQSTQLSLKCSPKGLQFWNFNVGMLAQEMVPALTD